MTPSKAVATLAQMVRAWRGIASHRLMASMIPLPQPVLFPLTKHTPVTASSQLTVDVAADVDEATVAATTVPDAQSVSALQVYRCCNECNACHYTTLPHNYQYSFNLLSALSSSLLPISAIFCLLYQIHFCHDITHSYLKSSY